MRSADDFGACSGGRLSSGGGVSPHVSVRRFCRSSSGSARCVPCGPASRCDRPCRSGMGSPSGIQTSVCLRLPSFSSGCPAPPPKRQNQARRTTETRSEGKPLLELGRLVRIGVALSWSRCVRCDVLGRLRGLGLQRFYEVFQFPDAECRKQRRILLPCELFASSCRVAVLADPKPPPVIRAPREVGM